MADAPLPAVGPPEAVYRVGRGLDAFAPPDWAYALPDGTFGNRFDDPSAGRGVPEEDRYRVVYCATERAGAFGEIISRFRPSVRLLVGLEEVEDEGPLDPELRGGVVPEEWRLSRRTGTTRLAPDLLLADVAAPETMRVLREEFAALAGELGLEDLDLSAVTGPHRRLTQEAARYVHDLDDASGRPAFAGIRYVSRLNPSWELWAVFYDRMRHEPSDVAEPIRADDPGLAHASALLGLRVEKAEQRCLRPVFSEAPAGCGGHCVRRNGARRYPRHGANEGPGSGTDRAPRGSGAEGDERQRVPKTGRKGTPASTSLFDKLPVLEQLRVVRSGRIP